jgi:hypothetical protein
MNVRLWILGLWFNGIIKLDCLRNSFVGTCMKINFHHFSYLGLKNRMHPYVTHLLEDIENAKRPGYSDGQPFYSNVEAIENDESALNEKESEKDIDEINPSLPLFKNDDDDDMPEDLAEYFAEVERYGLEEPSNCFGDYCGLKISDFPPAEQLSENDMQIIINAFEKMSFTWNIDFSFPETLPTHLHYTILINTLSEKTMITNHGYVTFDYCSGNPDGCIFGEYCNCLKYWQEED